MIEKYPWGTFKGQTVHLFKLSNASGSYVEILNYGAVVKSICVPDNNGKIENIIASYDTFEGYVRDKCYVGATIGRFANRIGNASFKWGNTLYTLDKNDGNHINHGGYQGFNSKIFKHSLAGEKLCLTLSSPEGEGGFPGNLTLEVTYCWTEDNTLQIDYKATSDTPTPLNITNHNYFNLNAFHKTITGHQLTIKGNQLVETDSYYVPTGNILPTGMRTFKKSYIKDILGNGINSYYIFDPQEDRYGPQCILTDPESGRVMQVFTSYPGVQLYTGHFLQSVLPGSHGRPFTAFDGLCLECHHYPDNPNHKNFPTSLVLPKEKYSERIVYSFDTVGNDNNF